MDSFAVEHEDDVNEPLKVAAAFSVAGYAQTAGDFMYFNPKVTDRQDENPLRLPERTFPVDLAYPRDYAYTLRLKLLLPERQTWTIEQGA